MNDIDNIFDNERKVLLEEFPIEIKNAIDKVFGEEDPDFDEEEKELYGRKYYLTDIKNIYEIICLGETAFDMRGRGDTCLLEDYLINLEIISVTRFNAVNTYICKKKDILSPAYAIYHLSDGKFHILKYL